MSISVTAAFFGSAVAPSNPDRSQHKLRCEAEASRKGPRTVRTGPGLDSSARLLPIQRWFVLFVHSEKETSEKDTKEDPLKVSYVPLETCYDHKHSVSHHVSSSLCLAAEADQPQKLVCRIVGVELAALVSYAQCQNGPSAHATNEDVVNPASDHGTENRKILRRHRWLEVKPKQFPCDYVPPCRDAVSRGRLQVALLLRERR